MPLSPARPLGLSPSFGYGDRLGLATPGHLEAHRNYGGAMRGVFAQQSIREMKRTGRSGGDVMRDARDALEMGGFDGVWGADADHLKTPDDVDATAAAGFVFFTIDPSDHVDPQADEDDESQLREKFAAVAGEITWAGEYRGRVSVPGGPAIEFDQQTVTRAAVKYGRAIKHAVMLSRHIDGVMRNRNAEYEIELSVDETPHPTTPAEHFIIAQQCLTAGMNLVSLAPRFIGDFEKGIDFKGDLGKLEHSLCEHAAIAKHLGPYKLSLHSGSDKLSMYEIFARATGGLFHVKTAGTSYLEALRAVARHDVALFRRIIDFSRERFPTDRATYHISARLDRAAQTKEISDAAKLEEIYLNEDDGRQILHVTFGSVLTDETLGPALREVLVAEPTTHREVLAKHFGRHLQLLNRGM